MISCPFIEQHSSTQLPFIPLHHCAEFIKWAQKSCHHSASMIPIINEKMSHKKIFFLQAQLKYTFFHQLK